VDDAELKEGDWQFLRGLNLNTA